MDVSVPQGQPFGKGEGSNARPEPKACTVQAADLGEAITLQLLAEVAGDNRLARTRRSVSSSPAARRALGGRRDASIAR